MVSSIKYSYILAIMTEGITNIVLPISDPILELCMLGKNSADNILIFFLIFPRKIGFDTLCKLSPKETICMKCQFLFSRKHKKNITSLPSSEFAHSIVSVSKTTRSYKKPEARKGHIYFMRATRLRSACAHLPLHLTPPIPSYKDLRWLTGNYRMHRERIKSWVNCASAQVEESFAVRRWYKGLFPTLHMI